MNAKEQARKAGQVASARQAARKAAQQPYSATDSMSPRPEISHAQLHLTTRNVLGAMRRKGETIDDVIRRTLGLPVMPKAPCGIVRQAARKLSGDAPRAK